MKDFILRMKIFFLKWVEELTFTTEVEYEMRDRLSFKSES